MCEPVFPLTGTVTFQKRNDMEFMQHAFIRLFHNLQLRTSYPAAAVGDLQIFFFLFYDFGHLNDIKHRNPLSAHLRAIEFDLYKKIYE